MADNKFSLLLPIALLLVFLTSTYYFATIYFTYVNPIQQQEGFYPGTGTYTLDAYPQDTDTAMWSVSTSVITANYVIREGAWTYHYDTDHPNDMSKMAADRPIPVVKYSVTFGAQVPFASNGTTDFVSSQEIYLFAAILKSDTHAVVDTIETRVIQNSTLNQLHYAGSLDFLPEAVTGSKYINEQNYTVFIGQSETITWENGTISRPVSYSGALSYSHEYNQFKVDRYSLRSDWFKYPNFSVVTYNQTLVGYGMIISITLVLTSAMLIYYRRKLRNT